MNAVTTTEQKPLTVRQQIERMTPEFGKALPNSITTQKFVRTAQTAVQMNPDIARAASKTEAGMQSLLAACMKAAQDGLVLDGREAALVTFNTKVSKKSEPDRWEMMVQYIPMVAGLMKKARNSGEISSIASHVVYKNDKFEYVLGDDERVIHEPLMNGDRGAPIAVYAIVRLKDGSVQREVMDRRAVMQIANQSKNAKQYDPETGKNYGEWWRKTVIRRISKYLPSSSDRDEFQQAVERIDEDFDYDAEPVEAVEQPKQKKRGGAAAALKDVSPADDSGPVIDHDHETGEVIEAEDMQEGDVI